MHAFCTAVAAYCSVLIFYILCIVSACLFLKFSDRDSWYSGKFSRDLSDLLSYVVNENVAEKFLFRFAL